LNAGIGDKWLGFAEDILLGVGFVGKQLGLPTDLLQTVFAFAASNFVGNS